MELIEENLAEALNAFDTCDRCSVYVQANAIVFMENGFTLTFCSHHIREYHDSLVDLGATIHSREISD